MEEKKVTLRDVSRLAGVSVGSVSRYINGSDNIKEQNRQRIQEAIESLGYTPSALARNLAKGESRNILIYMATEEPMSSATWLYGLPIIQGVNAVFEKTGYRVQISINCFDRVEDNYKNIENMIIQHSVDGILYVSSWEIDRSILEMLEAQDFPYILVGNHHPDGPKNDVIIDIEEATSRLIRSLYEAGHRSFGAIFGYPNQLHTKQRLTAFRGELGRLGLPCDEELVRTGSFDMTSGFSLMEEMIAFQRRREKPLPTAIICGNDDIACGVIRAAKGAGLAVPGDLSVTGFDNSIVGQIMEPMVTTMDISSLEMGQKAARMLFWRITNGNGHAQRAAIHSSYITRESTGAARTRP